MSQSHEVSSSFPTQAAIRELVTLGQAAQTHELQVLRPDAEPVDTYILFNKRTGEQSRHVAHPKPLIMVVHSTESLLRLARVAAEAQGDPEIHYAATHLTLLYNDKHRRYTVIMPLPIQPQFATLEKIAGKDYQQRDFWNLLRTVFRNSMSQDLISAIKTLTWSGDGADAASVAVGRESISRRVAAEVRGDLAIPDEYPLLVGVYDVREVRHAQYPVLCAIDTLIPTKSFRLLPVANALEEARDRALQDLVAPLLTQTDFPVYYGSAQ